MYPNLPSGLQDASGDPINTVEDLMKLENPDTGEAFTREEAEQWLPEMQRRFNEGMQQVQQRVDHIADVMMAVKDEADIVQEEFGDILKANPDVQKRLYAEFAKTLEIDPTTKLITNMPVSLAAFYRVALKPYADAAKAAGATPTPHVPATPQTQPTSSQPDPKEQRQRNRSDRSDIFGGGNTDTRDEDEKEWDIAAKEVFGQLMPRK